MTIKINGTNTAANPSITGTDTDTGIVYGSDQIDFSTGGSSKVTLNGSNFGIGTQTPDVDFHISGGSSVSKIESTASAASARLIIKSANNTYTGLHFGDDADDDVGRIRYYHNTDNMLFYTGASERMRLLSGGGLTFNGDTAAANALNDYEEGTWTASNPNAGYQYANIDGYYTKIGNLVHWNLHVTTSLVPNDNNTYEIHGLPYTSKNVGNNYGWATQITYSASSNSATVANMRALVQQNSTYLYFHTVGLGNAARVFNSTFRIGMQGQTMLLGGTYMAA